MAISRDSEMAIFRDEEKGLKYATDGITIPKYMAPHEEEKDNTIYLMKRPDGCIIRFATCAPPPSDSKIVTVLSADISSIPIKPERLSKN